MTARMDDSKAMEVIVDVICLLVVSLSRDEKEWNDWGLPFVTIVQQSQAQLMACDMGSKLQSWRSEYCCVGKGLGIVIIERNDQEEEFLFVDEVSSRLASYSSELVLEDEAIGRLLPLYVDNFVSFVVRQNSYDSRTRALCRQFCELFEVSYHSLSPVINSRSVAPTNEGEVQISLRDNVLDHSNRQSVLASYRLWRVAAAAVTGGAVFAAAVQFAAPGLITALLSIAGGSATVSQCLGSLSALLTSQLEGIGLIGSIGATVAGYKMLKRTDPIDEFFLEPLHHPSDHAKVSGLFSDEFVVLGEARGPGPTTAEENNQSNNSLAGSLPLFESDLMASQIGAASVMLQRSSSGDPTTSLDPIFILVPGQVEIGVDERQHWGADGILSVEIVNSSILTTPTSVPDSVSTSSSDSLVILSNEEESSKNESPKSSNEESDQGSPADSASCVEPEQAPCAKEEQLTTVEAATEDNMNNVSENAGEDNMNGSCISVTTEMSWHKLAVTEHGWWHRYFPAGEAFLLMWARKDIELFTRDVRNFASEQIKSIVLDQLLNISPVQALYLPKAVLDKAAGIDNPWDVVMDRARQAGQLLAHTLLSQYANTPTRRSSNRRPTTLIGYGMGAKVVFECLCEIARISSLPPHPENSIDTLDSLSKLNGLGRGIIENVVLMGAPVGYGMGFASGVETAILGHLPKWEEARSIVAGRFINCFSSNDWILHVLYRQKSFDVAVAGIAPVVLQRSRNTGPTPQTSCKLAELDSPNNKTYRNQMVADQLVENIDVTSLVSNLLDYPSKMRYILQSLRLEH